MRRAGWSLAVVALAAPAVAQRRESGAFEMRAVERLELDDVEACGAADRAGDRFPLWAGRIRIGSLADDDAPVISPSVSRDPAEIHGRGWRVPIRDLSSRNDTQVDGTRLETSPLPPGSRIKIAQVDLAFER